MSTKTKLEALKEYTISLFAQSNLDVTEAVESFPNIDPIINKCPDHLTTRLLPEVQGAAEKLNIPFFFYSQEERDGHGVYWICDHDHMHYRDLAKGQSRLVEHMRWALWTYMDQMVKQLDQIIYGAKKKGTSQLHGNHVLVDATELGQHFKSMQARFEDHQMKAENMGLLLAIADAAHEKYLEGDSLRDSTRGMAEVLWKADAVEAEIEYNADYIDGLMAKEDTK